MCARADAFVLSNTVHQYTRIHPHKNVFTQRKISMFSCRGSSALPITFAQSIYHVSDLENSRLGHPGRGAHGLICNPEDNKAWKYHSFYPFIFCPLFHITDRIHLIGITNIGDSFNHSLLTAHTRTCVCVMATTGADEKIAKN